jgi:3-oxoacyl-[acyl-carrier-protein] synthase-3
MNSCYIKATEYYFPEQIDSNNFEDKLIKKIGINSKHIASNDEYASDLAFMATEKLFLSGIDRNDIEFIIYCTQSPDYILPSTACILQHRLKLSRNCGALDINLGCSGFVYGLSLAKGLITSGQVNNVLLINADTYSKYINPQDRNVKLLFGDAGSATLICKSESPETFINSFVFGTDGKGAENLIIPAGGLRNPIDSDSRIEKIDEYGNVRSEKDLYMNGPEILKFALNDVPDAVNQLLQIENTHISDYDFFVFHQANLYMLELLRRQLNIPKEKFSVQLGDCGNTVSASIPIALNREVALGNIKNGDKVMLLGFGVGYSWAACSIKWKT